MTRDLRLVPTALVAWAAAWLLTAPAGGLLLGSVGVAPGAVAVSAAAVACACLALVPWSQTVARLRGIVPHLLLGAVCLAAVAGSVQIQTAARGALPELADDGAVAVLQGTVVSEPRAASFGAGHRWVLAVDQVRSRAAGTAVRGHVEVTAPGPTPGYGADVVVDARLGPPGIGAGDVASATGTRVVTIADPHPVLGVTSTLRTALADVTDDLSPQARGLVPGAAVGDTSRLPADIEEAMRLTGLTHVTAVSGSHFAIVVAVLTACCVALRAPRGVRVAALLVGATGFVLLVRPEPSVLRASWTCAVGLLALALGRPAAGPAALAVASTVLLVVDPWMSRSFGFALSCAATAGIVLLTGPLARRMEPWCGRTIAFAVAVPLAAQAACGPVLVLLDPALPAWAVPANLLAAPALVPATVLGLVATLLAPWAPWLAAGVAWTAGLATAWLAAVATFFAALPGARLPWIGGVGGALLLTVATAGVLWLVLRRGPGAGWRRAPLEALQAGRQALRGRLTVATGVGAAAMVACVAGLVIVLLVSRVGPAARSVPEDWQVVACDVGQGDTLVVRSGPQAAVVVDVGPPGPAAGRCLDGLGVDVVDLLVLSHFHTDHAGGLDAVLAGRTVRAAVVSPVDAPSAPAARARAALVDAEVEIITGVAGQEGVAGTVAWQVLAADGAGASDASGEGANDASVATAMRTSAGLDVVALGDLERGGQEALLRDLTRNGVADGTVEVVKMAHHGSAAQSAGLAALLAPRITLVPVGENDYGHPTATAIDLYAGVGSRVVRTDECGTTALVVRDGEIGLVCAERT